MNIYRKKHIMIIFIDGLQLSGKTTLINYPTISMFRKDIPSYSDMNVYINILYNEKSCKFSSI